MSATITNLTNVTSNLHKNMNFAKEMSKFRFKGIHNFLNDVKYVSVKEAPIDLLVKR
jgi:hypothetical protein